MLVSRGTPTLSIWRRVVKMRRSDTVSDTVPIEQRLTSGQKVYVPGNRS